MFGRITLVLVLLVGRAAWSQVQPDATGGVDAPDYDSQLMLVPPPVSGQAYPNTLGLETTTNYLSTSLAVNGGYTQNVLPSQTATPVNDATFAIFPTLAIAESRPHQQVTFTYSPSFLFYQPTSSLDTVDQGAALMFQDRLSPGLAFSVQDNFFRSSDVFDQSYLFSTGAISGSTQTPTTTLIAPFEEQLSNVVNGVISYQYERDSMVGGGASYSLVDFSGPSSSAGFSNSNASGATAFYNRRLFHMQYIGFAYQYSRAIDDLANQQSETQGHSLLPFYTIYFSRAFSVSITAGTQHVGVTLPQSPTYNAWTPTAVVSAGWQSTRANLAGNYTRTTSSGSGLFGAFNINEFGASGGWRVTRSWTLGLSAYYSNTANATPQLTTNTGGTLVTGGTSVAGQASVTHSLGEHFTARLGYERLHQQYSGIPIIFENPNSNQEYGRIAYQFRMPLRK